MEMVMIRSVAGQAREWAMIAARAVGDSMLALWRATAVWLAVAVLFVGGFVLGHIEASNGKRALRDRLEASQSAAAVVRNDRDAARAEAARLAAALAEAKAALAAKSATSAKKGK